MGSVLETEIAPPDRWKCSCVTCQSGAQVWVIMTRRVRLLSDGTFMGDEDKETRDYGYPMFYRGGRMDDPNKEERNDGLPRILSSTHWTQAIDYAYHFLCSPTEDQIAESLMFSPTLIGKVFPIQFRIR
jgi:hypothetical protein